MKQGMGGGGGGDLFLQTPQSVKSKFSTNSLNVSGGPISSGAAGFLHQNTGSSSATKAYTGS